MNIMDRVKNALGVGDEFGDEYYDDYEEEEREEVEERIERPERPERPERQAEPQMNSRPQRNAEPPFSQNRGFAERPQPARSNDMRRESNVVNMRSSARYKLRIINYSPTKLEEAQVLVDELKKGRPIILNLDKLDVKTSLRIFDFMCGANYALDGLTEKIGNNIFLFAPADVDIGNNLRPPLDGGHSQNTIPQGASSPWHK